MLGAKGRAPRGIPGATKSVTVSSQGAPRLRSPVSDRDRAGRLSRSPASAAATGSTSTPERRRRWPPRSRVASSDTGSAVGANWSAGISFQPTGGIRRTTTWLIAWMPMPTAATQTGGGAPRIRLSFHGRAGTAETSSSSVPSGTGRMGHRQELPRSRRREPVEFPVEMGLVVIAEIARDPARVRCVGADQRGRGGRGTHQRAVRFRRDPDLVDEPPAEMSPASSVFVGQLGDGQRAPKVAQASKRVRDGCVRFGRCRPRPPRNARAANGSNCTWTLTIRPACSTVPPRSCIPTTRAVGVTGRPSKTPFNAKTIFTVPPGIFLRRLGCGSRASNPKQRSTSSPRKSCGEQCTTWWAPT